MKKSKIIIITIVLFAILLGANFMPSYSGWPNSCETESDEDCIVIFDPSESPFCACVSGGWMCSDES